VAFHRDGDERAVRHPEAAREARALLDVVRNSPVDGAVQVAVGHLYWARFASARRTTASADGDRRSALAHFSAVHDDHPEVIPGEARAVLDRIADRKALASNLMDRAAAEHSERSLDQAVAILREVVDELGEEDPTLPVPLSELAVALDWRHKITGRVEEIGAAMTVIDRAVALTHPDDEERPRRLHLRKWLLVTRYDQFRGVADLEEAISVGHELLDGAQPDDPDLGFVLGDFVALYSRRYQRTQAIADLDRGIDFGRRALAVFAGRESEPGVASLVDDIAVALRDRGERTGRTADLDEAVDLGRQAVADYPADDADHVGMSSRLGESLRRAGEARRSVELLREALRVATAVLRRASERTHPAVPGFRQNVGLCHLGLGRLEADATQIEQGVAALRTAHAEDPANAAIRSDLGIALAALAEHSDNHAALLDEAIELHSAAVGEALDDPSTAQLRINLAAALRTRNERDETEAGRSRAVELFRSVAVQEAVSTRLRLIGARSWGMLAADVGDWAVANHALGLAVDLLTRVSAPNLERDDQERQLMAEPGLVAEAVAAALEVGDVDRAAELFEQGRGVLTAHALDLRTDVGRLVERDPNLADAFLRLRDALDADGPDRDDRHLWADRWQTLLGKIRALPGFADFLLPLTVARIRAAAAAGPLVMVNVARRRSDALVVRPDSVTLVRLPLRWATMESNVLAFVVAIEVLGRAERGSDQARRANDQVDAALRWAWQAVAGPVLAHLGLDGPRVAGGRRPRMWWMPSALLNFLPLHAAIPPDDVEHPRSVLDVVVSSYTPTVRSLVQSRERTARAVEGLGPLVVAMEHTPGQRHLPGVSAEARFIQDEIPGTVCLIDEEAEWTAVREQLPHRAWVHFSCHGTSDRTNPSASHLLLARAAPLELLEIARQRLDADLAFLSACSTGTPGLALVDESLHIAGAFQLAGYRHVVAAMWPIVDTVARRVVERVYALIRPGSPSVDHLATIVHDAVLLMRRRYPAEPALWAAFVHFGP
jgi:tetratricopeptide (TPR) repeat protein